MNSIWKEADLRVERYQELKMQLLELLMDKDLNFNIGGESQTLVALCIEIGEIEQVYIESFLTFNRDFSYRNAEPGIENSVTKLSEWFKELDHELKEAVNKLSEDEIESRTIECMGDFFKGQLTIRRNMDLYRESLLIFYGKASVYLKALGKPLPHKWQDWIG
jgi:hypothetical protein